MRTGRLGAGARYAFAARADGVSRPPYDAGNMGDHVGDDPLAVATNRATLAGALGVPADHLVAMAPVHGADVAVVRAADAGDPPAVDIMVTTEPGCALLVLAADCVPVLLADPVAGVAAVVHSGWRGVRADATGTALAAMLDHGARSADVMAVVGPAICGRCYPVDRSRFDAVVAAAPAAAGRAGPTGWHLDLRAAVLDRLTRAGVRAESFGGCTFEQPHWFSYRRDAVTGRHGGAVVLAAAA